MISALHSAKDDRIYYKQARSLRAAGHKVSIISGQAGPQLKDMSGNALAEGPDELGIEHYLVTEPHDLWNRSLKKIYRGDYYKRFFQKAIDTGADVFVAHEAQSIYIARKAAEISGGQYVFDSHESLHLNSPKAKYAIRKEYPRLSYFTAANPQTQAAITELAPNANSEVIYNASILPARPIAPQVEIIIAHEGSLPFNRGLKLMMEAFALLKDLQPDFKLRIVGDVFGEERSYFDEVISQHGLENNIQVTGWMPYESLGDQLSDASIGLILNTPTPNNLYAGPSNKLFNYMACNMAVVSVDLPETTRILNETGAGIILQDRSPAELSATLAKLLSDTEQLEALRSAAHEAHKRYSWEEEQKKLLAFYSRIS